MRPPMNIQTFRQHEECWPDVPAPARQDAFYTLSPREQDVCWRDLDDLCRRELEDDVAYERALGQEWPTKRHQPAQRSTAATSTRPGSVALSATDDPLKQLEPRVYVEALTGEVVPASGMMCCPLPDHDDRRPSFQVLSSHWRCFGCGRGGSVIDFAAALYGIEPRGPGYWRLRDRILEALVWAPNPREKNR
jgi:hypothetical protein